MDHTATHQAGAPGASAQTGPEKLPGIRHIVAIGSGKGGAGDLLWSLYGNILRSCP